MTTQTWVKSAESWRTTALRTGGLALIIGIGVGAARHNFSLAPPLTLLALWFTLGGHFVELLFRNQLRQHISHGAVAQLVARVVYWFAGGSLLFEGALVTRALLGVQLRIPYSWWMAGIAFVAVELLIHLFIRSRGQANFYDGRG